MKCKNPDCETTMSEGAPETCPRCQLQEQLACGVLLACPFCGENAECHGVETHDGEGNADGYKYHVTCGTDGCYGNAFMLDTEFRSREEACEMWNRRNKLQAVSEAEQIQWAAIKAIQHPELLCEMGIVPSSSESELQILRDELGRMPICWVCDQAMESRAGKFVCVLCDSEYRKLEKKLSTESEHLEQMTMAANHLHKELKEAEGVIAAARESCTSTLVFLGGEPTEDDHWRASQSAGALRKALQAFDAISLVGRAAGAGAGLKPSAAEATDNDPSSETGSP